MSQHKKINFVQLIALALAAVAYSPKDDEAEFSDWADATLASLPQTSIETLYDERLIDEKGTPTSAGMKLLLNGCSFTPNFQRLAQGDFSTAIKMVFEGQKALAEKVANQEIKQIVPRKDADGGWVDTRMCDSLLATRDWIDQVTSEYRASLMPVVVGKLTRNTKTAKQTA